MIRKYQGLTSTSDKFVLKYDGANYLSIRSVSSKVYPVDMTIPAEDITGLIRDLTSMLKAIEKENPFK